MMTVTVDPPPIPTCRRCRSRGPFNLAYRADISPLVRYRHADADADADADDPFVLDGPSSGVTSSWAGYQCRCGEMMLFGDLRLVSA